LRKPLAEYRGRLSLFGNGLRARDPSRNRAKQISEYSDVTVAKATRWRLGPFSSCSEQEARMPQQNNNPNAHRQNQDGKEPSSHKMAPSHDNRPQEAKDNNQGDKPGHKATSNNDRDNKDNR
jgi:hypothetical protein